MSHPQIDRLMDNVRVHLPGAVDSLIQREIFNTLDEFLKTSLLWTEEIPVDLSAGETIYDVIPAAGQPTQLITVVNPDGITVGASMAEPYVLVLQNTPTTEEELTATVALTVVDPVKTDGNPEVPEWIVTKYYLGILDGVLGRMMSQPAKPYSNERLAIYHLRRFRDATAGARVDARRKNVYGAQRWRYPQNFA